MVYILTAGRNSMPLGAHATWRNAVAQANTIWPNRSAFQPVGTMVPVDGAFTWHARSVRANPPVGANRPQPVALYITSLWVSYARVDDFAISGIAA